MSVEAGSILCIPSWALNFPVGTKIRLIGKLEAIDTQQMCLKLKYNASSIDVDFSLPSPFQILQGEIYEVYGTLERFGTSKDLFVSALIVNIVEGADVNLIEQCLKAFNRNAHPEFQHLFI